MCAWYLWSELVKRFDEAADSGACSASSGAGEQRSRDGQLCGEFHHLLHGQSQVPRAAGPPLLPLQLSVVIIISSSVRIRIKVIALLLGTGTLVQTVSTSNVKSQKQWRSQERNCPSLMGGAKGGQEGQLPPCRCPCPRLLCPEKF